MLNCFVNRKFFPLNKTISEYCKNSTNESIRKLTENYNLERNKPKIKEPFEDNGKPEINFFNLLLFLSISTVTFYFYKRLK
jgi:hypothetical protein